MNEKKHTSGPWIADKNWLGIDTYGDGNSIPVFPQGGGVAICDVVTVTGEGLSRPDVQARGEANAKLIAAAPDMFDALQAIIDAFGDQDSLLIDQCKTALYKAKGDE